MSSTALPRSRAPFPRPGSRASTLATVATSLPEATTAVCTWGRAPRLRSRSTSQSRARSCSAEPTCRVSPAIAATVSRARSAENSAAGAPAGLGRGGASERVPITPLTTNSSRSRRAAVDGFMGNPLLWSAKLSARAAQSRDRASRVGRFAPAGPRPIHFQAMSAAVRGFILQPTYRIESGRPVVQLFGRLETGEPFLVRDTHEKPYFYVAAEDSAEASRLGAQPLAPTSRVTLDEVSRWCGSRSRPRPTPRPLRDRLRAAGIACYEADVRFAMRYLIDRGIRGRSRSSGEPRRAPALGRGLRRPGARARRLDARRSPCSPSTSRPIPRRAASAVDRPPRLRRVRGAAARRSEGWSCPDGALAFASESDLLAAFCRRVRELDPDVLTGWNVVDFDLTVLARSRSATERAARAGPRAGERCACARERALRGGSPRHHPRPRGARRHRAAARRLRRAWRSTRSTPSRGRCSARASSSPATTAPSEILRLFSEDRARLRRVQPDRRAAGARDPRHARGSSSWRSSGAC